MADEPTSHARTPSTPRRARRVRHTLGIALGVVSGAVAGEALAATACRFGYTRALGLDATSTSRFVLNTPGLELLAAASVILVVSRFLVETASRRVRLSWLLAVGIGVVATAAAGESGTPEGIVCHGDAVRLRTGHYEWGSSAVDPAAEVTVTSRGLRAPDIDAERSALVLLVGDSFVFGTGLPDDETIAAQAAAQLGDASVANAGLEGDTLAGSLERAVYWAEQLRPDAIVVAASRGDATSLGGTVDLCRMPRLCRSCIDVAPVALTRPERPLPPREAARITAALESLGRLADQDGTALAFLSLDAAVETLDAGFMGPAAARWDVLRSPCSEPGMRFGDGRGHPNRVGAACYADVVASWFANQVGAPGDPPG